MVFLAWSSNLQPLPEVIGHLENDVSVSKKDVWGDDWGDSVEDNSEAGSPLLSDTMPAYREHLRKTIWGKAGNEVLEQGQNVKVMIMVLDAATTGRLSMNMYAEMPVSEFYENVGKWNYDTGWLRFNGKQRKNEIHSCSLYEIADYAYGTEQGDFVKCKPEVRNDIILKLIPCVVEGRNIPSDIVGNLVHKACRPTSYKNNYNWRKVLETTCALIRKRIIEEKEKRKEKGNMKCHWIIRAENGIICMGDYLLLRRLRRLLLMRKMKHVLQMQAVTLKHFLISPIRPGELFITV